MNRPALKLLAFEYILKKIFLLQSPSNIIGRLKANLILYIVCYANISKSRNKYPLLSLFDNFMAMPYGPMQADIFEHIVDNKGMFEYFELTYKSIICRKTPLTEIDRRLSNIPFGTSNSIKDEIDKAFDFLLSENPNIFSLPSNTLLPLIKDYSWSLTFYNRKNELRPIIDIKNIVKDNISFKTMTNSCPIKAPKTKAERLIELLKSN